ncbi:MAG: signal transduction histidine kinase/tetratricopeptide (TPR) repeat protein [Cellvibrionaceae bacterium]|jgi:signal transduction histidine kinase/tetratricopeptide (TPR) repeat protein
MLVFSFTNSANNFLISVLCFTNNIRRYTMSLNKSHIDQLLQEGWTGRTHDISKSHQLTKQALELARAHSYTLGIIRGLRNLAAVYDDKHDYPKSLALIMKALDMIDRIEEGESLTTDSFDLYLLAANGYLRLGDLHESLAYSYKAENIAIKLSDQPRQADVYKAISNSYFMIQNYPKAISYLAQAREVLHAIGDVEGEILMLNNLSHFCHHSGDLEGALMYGNMGLELCDQVTTSGGQYRRFYGYILNNIGITYTKANQFDEATPFFNRALAEFEQDMGPYGAIFSWRGLGQINVSNKNFILALHQLKKALKLAEKSSILIEQKITHYALAEAYKGMQKPELALTHFEQFYTLEKQLFNDETEKKIRNLEATHRIQQAQNEARISRLKTVELQNEIDERKKVEAELWNQAAQLEGLRQMGLELASKLELNALLDAIVIKAMELLKGDSGFLFLHQPEENDLAAIISHGPFGSSDFDLRKRIKPNEGLSGRVWQEGKSRVQRDYWNWAGRMGDKENAPDVTLVSVPIQWGNEFLGVLNVATHNPDDPFAESTELLEMFGLQAAVAIYNAQLHKQIKTHADEMEKRVTERTQELVVANKRLLELDTLKSQLINNVSHELRTPVSSIGLYIELLERSPEDKRQHYIETLRTQKNRLSTLIDGIITISHLHNNSSQFALIDMNQVVAQVVENQHSQAESKNLSLTFTPLVSLPLIEADPRQIATAITNICGNAIKYTESGSVSLSTHVQEEMVCIKISDTGIGVLDDDLPHLFDHFYRGREVAQLNIPGIGLGLTIAKEIVAFHGGEIVAENVVGEGAVFKIYLPTP